MPSVMPDAGSGGGIYTGGCHCGAVRITVALDAVPVIDHCNCSMCVRTNYLHLLVAAEALTITQGEDALTEYTFNTGQARHRFCRHCGVKSFYVPRSHPHGYSVNARCLDNFDAAAYALREFDGRNFEQHIDALRAATQTL